MTYYLLFHIYMTLGTGELMNNDVACYDTVRKYRFWKGWLFNSGKSFGARHMRTTRHQHPQFNIITTHAIRYQPGIVFVYTTKEIPQGWLILQISKRLESMCPCVSMSWSMYIHWTALYRNSAKITFPDTQVQHGHKTCIDTRGPFY